MKETIKQPTVMICEGKAAWSKRPQVYEKKKGQLVIKKAMGNYSIAIQNNI